MATLQNTTLKNGTLQNGALQNKVVWNEGLFVQPQHFQHQERYLEAYVNAKTTMLPYQWGFQTLELDQGLLSQGKIAIQRASGIFPDGTPFAIPDTHPAPTPLSLPAPDHNIRVYLGIPRRQHQVQEVDFASGIIPAHRRYRVVETQLCDVVTNPKQEIDTQLSALNVQLLSDRDSVGDYAALALADVNETQSSGSVSLNTAFIPPLLNCSTSPVVTELCHKLVGLLQQQTHKLSGSLKNVVATHQETLVIVQVATMNRALSTLQHLMSLQPLHPERLFGALHALWAELFSLKVIGEPLPSLPEYQHDNAQASFQGLAKPLVDILQESSTPAAINLTLTQRGEGDYLAVVEDVSLYTHHDFYLAIRADLSEMELRDQMSRIIVASDEQVNILFDRDLKGIPLTALSTQPAGIPYRDNTAFTFFKLDTRSTDYWPSADSGQGFAVRVNQLSSFPNLAIELWATKTPTAQR